MDTGEVEAMNFLLNIPYFYPILSLKKIVFSYIVFVKSSLTPCSYVEVA
jgi:hypothetical protein